jgi:hypothetical protein
MFYRPDFAKRTSQLLAVCALAVPIAMSGCGRTLPGGRSTAPSGVVRADLGPQNSVKALIKAIKLKLEEHTALHGVVMTDVQVLPCVIWNLFNLEGTLEETIYQSGVFTYQIVGTYDVLTKDVVLSEKTLISVTPLTASSNTSTQVGLAAHSR